MVMSKDDGVLTAVNQGVDCGVWFGVAQTIGHGRP
jgi:hypothetical protein